MPQWIDSLDSKINEAFEYTHLPQLSEQAFGYAGRGFDQLFDTNIAPTVSAIGRDLPRMTAESIATLPLAASGAGAPSAVAIWANRLRKLGQIAGYADAAVMGTAETGSLAGGAINAATMGLGNKFFSPAGRRVPGLGATMDVGEYGVQAADKLSGFVPTKIDPASAWDLTSQNLRDRGAASVLTPRDTYQKIMAGVGRGSVDIGAATALNEASRQATMSVGPNAVGLDDPSRNPLTPENIAGNVVNALPMGIAAGAAARDPMSRSQVLDLNQWTANRKLANAADARARLGYEFDGTMTATEYFDAFGKNEGGPIFRGQDQVPIEEYWGMQADDAKRMEAGHTPKTQNGAIVATLKARLGLLRAYREEGRLDEAATSYQEVVDLLNGDTAGLDTVEGITMMKENLQGLDQTARQRPPETPKEMLDHIDSINDLIDQANVDSKGVSSVLVGQMADKGLIEYVTPAELKRLQELEVQKSGDIQFSYQVAIQAETNRVLREISKRIERQAPAAREAFRNLPPDPTVPQTEKQGKATQRKVNLDLHEKAYVTAMAKLPKEIEDAFLQRAIDMRRKQEYHVPGSERAQSIETTWRKKVIAASKAADPDAAFRSLIAKDEHGNWLYNPKGSNLKIGEGGKSYLETNIVDEKMTPGDMTDEVLINEALAEEGGMGEATGENVTQTIGTSADSSESLFSTSEASKKLRDQMYADSQRVPGIIDSLTDDQLALLGKESFKQKGRMERVGDVVYEKPAPRDPKEQSRKPLYRAAVKATLQDLKGDTGTTLSPEGQAFMDQWYADRTHSPIPGTPRQQMHQALRQFWAYQSEPGFNTAGMAKGLTPMEQRMSHFVTRLLDKDVIADVRRQVPPVAKGVTPTAPEGTAQPRTNYGSAPTPGGKSMAKPEVNDLTDTTAPGSITADVYATFRDRFDTILGDEGYSGSMRDMMTEAAVAIIQQMPEKMVDFYRLFDASPKDRAAGLAMQRSGRGKIGIDMMETAPNISLKSAMGLLQTLAHEVSHIDSYIAHGLINAPDAFSERRRGMVASLENMVEHITVPARAAMLTTLRDSLIPKEYRKIIVEPKDTTLPYGSILPSEFTAELNSLLSMSLLFGKKGELKNRFNVLDYSPTEVREFAQGTLRHFSDILEGMKGAITDKNPQMHAVMTSKMFGAVLETAREASKLRDSDKALAQARTFVSSIAPRSGNAPPMVTEAMWFHEAAEAAKQYADSDLAPVAQAMPHAVQAIRAANQYINARAYDRMTMPGIWARWFYPFTNLMESMQRAGFDLARPMGDVANGVEPQVTRLRSAMLTEWTMKKADGGTAWAKDNDLINRINENKTGPWRDTFNDLSAWQQKNNSQSLFIQDPTSGQIIVNTAVPGAQAKWDASRQRLTPKDQQAIMSGMVAMDKTEQIKSQHLMKSIDEGNAYRIARMLMSGDQTLTYDRAIATGQEVMAAYLQNNALALQTLVPNPRLLQTLDGLLKGPEGLLTKTAEVRQKLGNRPGYRSEALPFDWILRYAEPTGEIRYLSAKSKLQGEALMKDLRRQGMTQQGEVISRKDLREFTDFDDPATLLEKYTEVETEKWGKFVRDLEQAFGPAFAAEMAGYVPGAAVAKELGARGLNQFLVERKNLVDRGRFDYIDGTMASVDRLAAAIGFREARARKDLMLADPRAKQFPSFGKMVNKHFEYMMEPNGQGAKELKTFSTAMMMGGSLASVLVNLSQSVISLVPILIQHDTKGRGPVGAWGGLGKAIKNAADASVSDKWQTTANAALARDATGASWTVEESRAMAYKWSMEDGGIDHGIILDHIFTPLDQNTSVNAKFGRGDYGPTTLADKIRSPIFMGAQLSLKPFGWAERMNNKIALMAGIDQAYEQGLRGQKMYDHAKLVKNLSTYGGGKANTVGFGQNFSATPFARSAFGVVNNLQQYGYGIVATYAQLMKDSLGKSKGLTPMQRRQAQKSFATMLSTQLAVAGALGLPFAAAGLTVLEKVFGIPANQLVREGLASISDDKEEGAEFAEMALNGIGNQMFGIDISSRLGVSNLMGTSSYRGFNLNDMAGPTVSIASNVIESLGYFGSGQVGKGMTSLVPNSFRNLVMMSDSWTKYGDLGMRDAGDNLLYKPTLGEAAKYLFGFRPKVLSQKKQAQAMTAFAEQRGTQQYGSTLDEYSRSLLSGDPSEAMRYAYSVQASDPTVDPKGILQSMVKRAVDATTERDLLAQGSRASEGERAKIAGLFPPGVVNRQSELQRTILGIRLGAQVGLAPEGRQVEQAGIVDALIRNNPSMPRSQALRLAEMLH